MNRWMVPLLLALSLACQPEAPLARLEACPDQPCRSAALLPAWRDDPAGTGAWLAGLADPTVQATLIEGLALEQPEAAASLCASLPESGHARERCLRRVVRPHLEGGGAERKLAPQPRSLAPGPRSSTLPLLPVGEAPWLAAAPSTLAAALAGCDQASPALCARIAAREAARERGWEAAGLACMAGDPTRGEAYAECLFQAAEERASSLGAPGLPDSLRLCSHSSFGPMCVAHTLTAVGPQVPGAEALGQDDVAGALAVVEAIRRASAEAPEVGAIWVDRYWSSWAWSVVAHSDRLARPAVELPEGARHHLIMALAMRQLREARPRALELEAQISALQALLEAGPPSPPARGSPRPLVTWHRRQAWPGDRGEEREIPATWVTGPARRALAEDPAVDLRICVLEAAAQLEPPPPASFFLAPVGRPEEHRLVRWTGARIGGMLDPAAAGALTDPDPLVQATLERPRRAKPQPPGP
jgi:hypothetical protein